MTHTYEYEPDTQIKRVKLKYYLPKGETVMTALDMRRYFPLHISEETDQSFQSKLTTDSGAN